MKVDPMMIMAGCFVVWTIFLFFGAIAALGVAWSIRGSVKRMEQKVEDLKGQLMPTIIRSQDLLLEFKSMGKDLRKQVKKSESAVEETLRNVSETTSRIRDAVTGLSLVLGALGRVLGPFSGSRSK